MWSHATCIRQVLFYAYWTPKKSCNADVDTYFIGFHRNIVVCTLSLFMCVPYISFLLLCTLLFRLNCTEQILSMASTTWQKNDFTRKICLKSLYAIAQKMNVVENIQLLFSIFLSRSRCVIIIIILHTLLHLCEWINSIFHPHFIILLKMLFIFTAIAFIPATFFCFRQQTFTIDVENFHGRKKHARNHIQRI